MTTICPHCKQEFPDTPDEYLGVTLECPVCKKEFVCGKAKYCPECGAVSHSRAIICHRCKKPFPEIPQPSAAPEAARDYATSGSSYGDFGSGVRISSADNLSFLDNAGIKFCIGVGVFTPLAMICVIVALLDSHRFPLGYVLLGFLIAIPVSIVCFQAVYWLSMLPKSYKKIYWTPYRRVVLTAFCSLCVLLGIAGCVSTLLLGVRIRDLWTLAFGIPGTIGAVNTWNIFNRRAHEDIDYEEPDDVDSEERLRVMLSLANGFSFGTFIPFVGIAFLLLSVLCMYIYKRLGGVGLRKAVTMNVVGIVIQAVLLYWLRS